MKTSDRTELNEVFSGQRFMSSDWVPEQERNFDAQYSPPRDRMVLKGYETIDGKRYKVWQA